jgi:hypothetical protein
VNAISARHELATLDWTTKNVLNLIAEQKGCSRLHFRRLELQDFGHSQLGTLQHSDEVLAYCKPSYALAELFRAIVCRTRRSDR